MSRVRYDITGTFTTHAPLHVGNGEERFVDTVRGKDATSGSNTRPGVAAIVRDAADRPYIPATALKGLFRRLGEEAYGFGTQPVNDLFGTIKQDDKGHMGAILFRGASMETAPDASQLPYVQNASGAGPTSNLGPGVFVSARTGIDPATGTADKHKLFFQEMVMEGTAFPLRLVLETREDESVACDLLHKIIPILDRLAEEGAALGKNTADGFGQIQLDKCSVKISKSALVHGLGLENSDVSFIWEKRAKATWNAPHWHADKNLCCEGPFMVVDSSQTRKQSGDDHTPQLVAQRVRQNLPLLLGSSISGVLRARARWLTKLATHRAERPASDPDPAGFLFGLNDDPASLSPVQRLFGVTGFKGMLAIDKLKIAEAEPWDVTSVKLDRFSGGPIDNALFTSATFVGTNIRFTLALRERGALSATDEDIALAESLAQDITDNGLMLGHGTNKGFGWFEAMEDGHAAN